MGDKQEESRMRDEDAMSNGAAEAPEESPVPVSRHDDLVALEPDGALSCHDLLVSSDPSSSLELGNGWRCRQSLEIAIRDEGRQGEIIMVDKDC